MQALAAFDALDFEPTTPSLHCLLLHASTLSEPRIFIFYRAFLPHFLSLLVFIAFCVSQAVDKMWKSVMSATDKDPLVLSCVGEGKTYLADFQHANLLLEEIQKSLEEYLETKRMAFPRYTMYLMKRRRTSVVKVLRGHHLSGIICQLVRNGKIYRKRRPAQNQNGADSRNSSSNRSRSNSNRSNSNRNEYDNDDKNTWPPRQILLFVERRAAGNPLPNERPPSGSAAHVQVLRRHQKHSLRGWPGRTRHFRFQGWCGAARLGSVRSDRAGSSFIRSWKTRLGWG